MRALQSAHCMDLYHEAEDSTHVGNDLTADSQTQQHDSEQCELTQNNNQGKPVCSHNAPALSLVRGELTCRSSFLRLPLVVVKPALKLSSAGA